MVRAVTIVSQDKTGNLKHLLDTSNGVSRHGALCLVVALISVTIHDLIELT